MWAWTYCGEKPKHQLLSSLQWCKKVTGNPVTWRPWGSASQVCWPALLLCRGSLAPLGGEAGRWHCWHNTSLTELVLVQWTQHQLEGETGRMRLERMRVTLWVPGSLRVWIRIGLEFDWDSSYYQGWVCRLGLWVWVLASGFLLQLMKFVAFYYYGIIT